MIPHIPVIFRQSQARIKACLTSRHRHVGCVGNQGSPIHQRIAGFRVNQLPKLLQNLGHLIPPLSASNINNNISVRPLGNLMLSHGFSGSKTTWNGSCAALCQRKQRIQYSLSCHERLLCGTPSGHRSCLPDRPLLNHVEGLFRSI